MFDKENAINYTVFIKNHNFEVSMNKPHFSVFSRETFIIEEGAHHYHTFLIVLDGRFEVVIGDRHFVVGKGVLF